MKDFQGKRVLVTGGSSGIGLALSKALAARGAHVALLARTPSRLEAACEVVAACRKSPAQKVYTLAVDVTDADQTRLAVEHVVSQHGGFDLLINCASIAQPGKFVDQEIEIFRAMMDSSYFGTLHAIKAVLPGMIDRGSGHIVNFSSVAGFLGLYGYGAYGPAKFAVRGLSDTLRVELAEHNIDVSIVFPPDTQTPQYEYESRFKPPVLVELDKSNKVLTPEVVAEATLKGITRRRYIITPGFDSTLYFQLSNTFGLVYPVMDWMVAFARRAIRRGNGSGPAK